MSDDRQRVAVLGATGHVGKCLVAGFAATGAHEVTAVARDFERLGAFLGGLDTGDAVACRSFSAFETGEYDVVINCVGVGKPAGVVAAGSTIFELTERFDTLASEYVARHPGALYISFSSGAAYCGDFEQPVAEATRAYVPINALMPTDYYGAAKLAAEVRHRAASDLSIVDLRLFGLFSRYVDPSSRYLMTDVLKAIADGTVLQVGPGDVTRDYVDPSDLVHLVNLVIAAPRPINDVYDVYSAAPVAKFRMLEEFSVRFGLTFDVLVAEADVSATGMKPFYYSENRRAAKLGYKPTKSSLESLVAQMDVLVGQHEGGPA